MGSGEAVSVVVRSLWSTAVVTCAPLLALFGSPTGDEADAAFTIERTVGDDGTRSRSVNVALACAARVPIVPVTVPVPPAGGFESEKAGPLDCVTELNVVPAGTGSLS